MADQVRMPPPSIGGVVTLPARMTGAPRSDQESKNRGLQMSLVDPRAPQKFGASPLRRNRFGAAQTPG